MFFILLHEINSVTGFYPAQNKLCTILVIFYLHCLSKFFELKKFERPISKTEDPSYLLARRNGQVTGILLSKNSSLFFDIFIKKYRS